MAFTSKNRQRYHGIVQRSQIIQALAADGTPESRKARKAMNIQYHAESRTTLGMAWQPNGPTKGATGSNVKLNRINQAHKARNH